MYVVVSFVHCTFVDLLDEIVTYYKQFSNSSVAQLVFSMAASWT